MTQQEMFDKVWQHFVVEGNPPAVDGEGLRCMYRTDDGRRCAFGVLLPDELYKIAMEGKSPAYLVREYPELGRALGISVETAGEFILWLQSAHDDAAAVPRKPNVITFRVDIERRLRRVAAEFKLQVPEVGIMEGSHHG